MAYVLRFIQNCRKEQSAREIVKLPTIMELRKSTETIFKVIQHVNLDDEIRRVLNNEP